MTIRIGKITIDNSVNYIPQKKQTQEKDIKPNTIKINSLPHKQEKNLSQNNTKLNKNVAAGGFGIVKLMKCFF